MEAEFLYNPGDHGSHCHCASMILTGEGELLAVWYSYPSEEHRDARLVFTRKPKRSSKWEPSRGIISTLKSSAGNPTLAEDSQTHDIILFFVILKGPYWTDAVLHRSISNDTGRTWTLPEPISSERGFMVRHPPREVESGVMLVPAYRERESVSLLMKYSDGKLVMQKEFSGFRLIQPVLVQGQDRSFTLLFRPESEPCVIWRSGSSDGGSQWATPVKTTLPCPYSGVSAFQAGAKLCVVYDHTSSTSRTPLSLATSIDGGITWSAPKHIDTIPHEVSYPCFLSDEKEEVVYGIYTYNRRMMKIVTLSYDELP